MTMERMKDSEVGGMGTKRRGVVAGGEDDGDLIEMSIENFDESVGEEEYSGKDAYGDHGDVQTVVVVALQSSSRPHCSRYPSRPDVDEKAHNPLTTGLISMLLLLSWSLPWV